MEPYSERDASRAGLLEMRPFGEAKSISGHQTLQLMRRPYGVKGSVYVVTLPAFQRCLEDGPDAAERDNPGADSPPAGGQETAISRHITTYRQDRRDQGGQPTRLGVRGSIVPAAPRTSYSSFFKAGGRDLFSATEKTRSRFDSAQPNDTSTIPMICA